MSQQMNEVLNSDTIRGNTDQNATFMFQPAEFRPPSKEGLFPCAQMASEERKTQESDDSKTSVSVKLEVRDSIEDEGSSNSRPPQCLSKESLCDASMKLPASDAGEDLDSWKSNTSDKKRDEKSDAGFDSNPEREAKDEVDNETFTSITKAELSSPEPAVAEKRKRRPRGRKSANTSLRNYVADSPGDIEFDSPQIRTPPEGMFPTEKRKRGRPRGSRGTRGANSSIEQRSFNEPTGILTDISSGEVTGDFSNVSKYEPTPPIIKIGRGALRPGCKSYRGRAACMGRGYKVEYDETPSWGVETGIMPVEYDSALSPLTDVDVSDRRQYSADACTPPFAKRARGTRKRGRGRSRGRARVSQDRSMDSDSSDFGVSRFETPDYSTRGCDTPDLMDPNTESEVDAGDSVEKIVHKRRGRGRGSRGGRTSLEAADPDVALEATVTCAVCKETMTQQLFGYHKLRKHNNCSWREGIDSPLDLNDPKVVNSLLKVALQKKKQLTCEQCGISRSSLVGYQSHVTFCAKTEGERDALLETCPICKRRMMPSSLKVHMGVHRQEEKARELEKLQGTPEREDPGEGSSKNSGKSKRAAANRAVSLMQQFIKGEDIIIEGAGVVQVPSTTNMNELYVEKGKTNEGDGEDAADENKEVVISGYKMAAWTRAIQRCGVASCKNPGCTFKSKEVEKLAEHFKTCELKPNINFLCKLCSFGCESKEGIQEHVKKEHMDKSGEGSDGSGSVVSANESEESDDVEEEEEISDEEHDNKKIPKLKKVCGKVDTSTQNKKTTRFFKNVNFLARQGYSKLYGLQSYVTTFHWTLEFQLENFSHLPLYANWRTDASDWTLLDEKEAELYLPKARSSALFARMEINSDQSKPPPGGPQARNSLPWQQLSLFESAVEPPQGKSSKSTQSGFITLFAGGPVWAQAWCPTSLYAHCHKPSEGESKKKVTPVSQFMAVSCTPDFDVYHPVLPPKEIEKGLIQIWDFGPITNDEYGINKPPRMVLGIAHDFGAVWSLEWCPSGCYDELPICNSNADASETDSTSEKKKELRPLRRLGVLAAGCSDGTVRIFSVPFPSELNSEHPQNLAYIRHTFAGNSDDEKSSTTISENEKCTSEKDVMEGISSNENSSDVKTELELSDTHPSTVTIGVDGKDVPSALQSPSSKSKSLQTETSQVLGNNNEDSGSKSHAWPIYKASFVVTLILESPKDAVNSGNNWQCLCLSWSILGKSHRVLAGSFSNGLVALWDLNTSSSLLKVDQSVNGVQRTFLRPYQVFLAHTNAVTALALATCDPDKREDTEEFYPRFLVTGGRDRLLKIWDLNDTGAPVDVFPRGLISSVVWLTNWVSCVVSNDDGFSHGRSNSKIQAIRKYGYKPTPMLSQNSAVMSIGKSDWLNSLAHGTYGGEACILVAQQLLMTIESLKTLKNRKTMVFFTELLDFMKEQNNLKKPGRGKKAAEVAVNDVPPEVKDESMDCDDSIEVALGEKDESICVPEKKNSCSRKVQVHPHVPTYAEASKRFGILFCDVPLDHDGGKLPKDPGLRLQQSERMKESPINQYPIAGINTVCWNPNLQSFIWLATGHQAGFVRICRMQKTRNRILEKSEENAYEKIVLDFAKRKV